MDTRPMKPAELGKYVCVAHGGCRHSPHITITSDGVWVRSPDPDPLNPGSHLYSSAHRVCFEAWQGREALDIVRALAGNEAPVMDGTYANGHDWCTLCSSESNDPAKHDKECPWRRARELMG